MKLLSVCALLAVSLLGCSPGKPAPPPLVWDCPPEWVPLVKGGCGAAAVACASDGLAKAGACASAQGMTAHSLALGDGGTGSALFAGPTGSVDGPWATAGGTDGPPAVNTPAPRVGMPANMCPTGWTVGADDTCEPGISTSCEQGSAALPGGLCTRTGVSECGTETFPAVPVPTPATVVYVRAGTTSGSGSSTAPFATIAEGITAAGNDGWVLIAAGTYNETLSVTSRVHLRGVCATGVTVHASTSAGAVTVSTQMGNLDLAGLTLSNDAGPGIVVREGAQARIERMRVQTAKTAGVQALAGSSLSAQDVVVSAITPVTGAAIGNGFDITSVDAATLSRVHVEDTWGNGIVSLRSPMMRVTDVFVKHVEFLTGGSVAARGIAVEAGGSATVDRLVVDGVQGRGIVANDVLSSVTVQDAVLRNVSSARGLVGGTGLLASNGASVTATRVLVERTEGYGVSAIASVITLSDSVVRDMQPMGSAIGMGVDAEDAATLTLRHVHVLRAYSAGVRAFGLGVTVTVEDSVVERTVKASANPDPARGLYATQGAVLRAVRTWVRNNQNDGVMSNSGASSRMPTQVQLEDCVVSHNGENELRAAGLIALSGAKINAKRVLIDDNFGTAVSSEVAGTLVTLSRCVVSRTRSYSNGSVGAVGVLARFGSTIRVEQTSIEQNEEVGAGATEDSTTLQLIESRVTGSVVRADGRLGAGVIADQGSTLEVERSLVEKSTFSGILLFGSTLTFHDLVVDDVKASVAGLGAGVLAVETSTVTGERLSVRHASGAAVVALDRVLTGRDSISAPSTVTMRDVFLSSTRSSTVKLRLLVDGQAVRDGNAVSYGLHVGAACSMDIERAVIDGGGYGLYAAPESQFQMRKAFILGQLDAAGAFAPGVSLGLADVQLRENARDVMVEDSTLPEATAIAPPTPVCPSTGCL